jgi:hypothetical protein
VTDPSDTIHTVTLERLASGDGDGFGTTFAAPETVQGFVNDQNKLVRAASGDQVVSSTQVALDRAVGYVQPRSRVTLPAIFGGRTATVIGCEVGDAGGLPEFADVEHVVLLLE